ncbi:MAG: family NAD(P)-dependent oxidoreductase [Burkholderiales bacterium]|jgi:NAD(P)-dependent dehydrogenase (short-subunit alcohol dehydrogenase family)|nr:family NAD(P)-dependent oxidoreductase [Burkholderiales bacterium]
MANQAPARSRLLSLLNHLATRPAAYLNALAQPLLQQERTQLAGKTYVITGASSGIGRGVALALAAERANVVLAARRGDALQDAAREAEASGGQALAVTTDVSNPEDVQRLAEAALARFGRIDVWINNAGVGAIGPFERIPPQDHARLIDVNLKGAIYGSHAALTQFKRQGRGVLINVGSAESELPLPYHASYVASKYGLLGLGRALNEELQLAGETAVTVATVLPWGTDTPFFSNAANYIGHAPRVALMDAPAKVVNTILRTALAPREEVPVGWKGRLAYHSHRLFDDLSERLTARSYHWLQLRVAPPAADGPGALHTPSATPATVEGGVRRRIRQENRARLRGQQRAP